jgi:hypothetical protein
MAEQDIEGGRGGLPMWVPIVVAAGALIGGVGAGALADHVLRPAEIQTEVVTRGPSAIELDAACQPLVAKVTEQLDQAATQVSDLVEDVKTKEARVHDLEAEMKKRSVAGAALRQELAQAKADLAVAKQQLEVALAEKQQLVVQLKTALVDLDSQKQKTASAKQQAWDYGWQAFVSTGELQVCERGNRKKLGRCREAVVDLLTPLHDDYEYCLRTGQAMPSLQEAEKKQESIPQFARWLDQDNRIVKGWYIQMCDPTLPEAKDLAAVSPDPNAQVTAWDAPTDAQVVQAAEVQK